MTKALRRATAMIIALLLLLTMVACGQGSPDGPDGQVTGGPESGSPDQSEPSSADLPTQEATAAGGEGAQGRYVEDTLDFGEDLRPSVIGAYGEDLYALCYSDAESAFGLYRYVEGAPEKLDISPIAESWYPSSLFFDDKGVPHLFAMDYSSMDDGSATGSEEDEDGAPEEAPEEGDKPAESGEPEESDAPEKSDEPEESDTPEESGEPEPAGEDEPAEDDASGVVSMSTDGDGNISYEMPEIKASILKLDGDKLTEIPVEMPQGDSPQVAFWLGEDMYFIGTYMASFIVDGSGKKVADFNKESSGMMLSGAAADGKVYEYKLNSTTGVGEMRALDGLTGAEIETIETPDFRSTSMYSTHIAADAAGNLYIINADGIYRRVPGGDKWEQLIDGLASSLSITNLSMRSIAVDDNGSVYVLTNQMDLASMTSEDTLYRFAWSDDAPVLAQTEIDILAVADYDGVRSAISAYQREHPEVKINYRAYVDSYSYTYMGYEGIEGLSDMQAKVDDAIRAINTEVLSGNMPDILIMDLLPMQNYIDKGFMLDLGEYANGRIEDGTWYSPVIDSFRKEDGTLPALATRFSIPVYWGTKSDTDQITDLASLVEYANSLPEDSVLTATVGYTMLLTQLFPQNSMEWVGDDGKMDFSSEKFREFAEALAELQAKLPGDQTVEQINEGMMGKIVTGKIALYQDYMAGASNQMLGIALMGARKQEPGCIPLPNQSGKKVFLPQQIVGVSQETQQKDIVLDFLDTLLGADAQKADMSYSGYPVDAAVLDEMLSPVEQSEEGSFYASSAVIDGYAFEMKPLDEESSKIVKGVVYSLDTPSVVDYTLQGLVTEGMKPYLMGQQSLDDMIAALTARTKAYLAE